MANRIPKVCTPLAGVSNSAPAIPSRPNSPRVRAPAPACRPRSGPPPPPTAPATALACTALAASVGTRPELAVWLLMTPVTVLLAIVDHRVRRLPDALTLPLAGLAAAALGAV